MDGSLVCIPSDHAQCFLSGECWKYQVRIGGFPRESLGFIQSELQQVSIRLECVPELREDCLFHSLDLCDDLSARRDARAAQSLISRFSSSLISFYGFHFGT